MFSFPILYDIKEMQGNKTLREKRGLYDYDRNMFVLRNEQMKQAILTKHPDDWAIIESVGYTVG